MSFHESFYPTESKHDDANVFLTLAEESSLPLFRSIGGDSLEGFESSFNNVQRSIVEVEPFPQSLQQNPWDESGLVGISSKKSGLDDVLPFTGKVEQDVLSPVPVYFERTSFSVPQHKTPTDILASIVRELKPKFCDFSIDVQKYLIRVTTAPSNLAQSFTFHVQLFRNGDGTVLVEFQRRNGCIISFSNFYRGVSNSIKRGLDLETEAISDDATSTLHSMWAEVDLNSELLDRLVEMGDCDGIISISSACMSSQANLTCAVNAAIQSPKLCQFTLSSLKSEDKIEQLAAARLLSRLATDERTRKSLLDSCLSQIFLILDSTQSALLFRDVKRELAQMLLTCSATHGSIIKSGTTSLANINALRKAQAQSNDPVLASIAAALLQCTSH